ncbi:MAG: sulfide/dihydroorotate dehydrogenase-like FAD/NAD-binding protein [Firmicutes bacterium]|nr:sulfide/dihydroorotate dehydrogenase-like FAD/NAD-binding protein [Bacillota bacterium]
MYRIVEKSVLNPVIKEFVVEAPLVARKAEPGQFVIVRLGEQGERVPLTIADFDRERGTITIVFQEVGKSTRILGCLDAGQSITDVVGPLGIPAELPESGSVACVAGGVGVAPMYPKAKAMHAAGIEVVSIVGARSADLLIMEDRMKAVSSELHVCTDDGSRGFHGFVSEKLKALIESGRRFDEVIAIGPLPMMRATCEVTRPLGLKTWVSLNSIMVDGTGMCGACRVTVGGRTKFCCVDGPMFDGHEVDFKEAIRRSQIYCDQEKTALEQWEGCSGHIAGHAGHADHAGHGGCCGGGKRG